MQTRTAGWWGVVVAFLGHGIIVSTWVSRIAGVKEDLKLSDGALGFSLLGAAIGAVSSIPFAGWLVSRFGSRRPLLWSIVGFCIALVLPPLAWDRWTLFVVLFIYGFMSGVNDVSMNANAVGVDKLYAEQRGKSTISRFHAMFSLGGIGGSVLGGAIASHGVTPRVHLASVSAFLLISLLLTSSLIANTPSDDEHAERLSLSKLPRALLVLSFIGFCIFLSEGAVADWTAVFIAQVLHGGPGLAAAGYGVFSASMAVFRLLGDSITNALGRVPTIRLGGILASIGMAWMSLASTGYWALPGLVIAGAGYSSIIPLVFAAGGRIRGIEPGVGVATVSGLGYLGFLFGPPAIGAISQATNLRVGLFLLVVLAAAAAALVGTVGTREGDSASW